VGSSTLIVAHLEGDEAAFRKAVIQLAGSRPAGAGHAAERLGQGVPGRPRRRTIRRRKIASLAHAELVVSRPRAAARVRES
jgi:hypothetical protein